MRTLDRTLQWLRNEDNASMEYATVASKPDGIALSGLIVAAELDKPLRLDYRLLLDARWQTRALRLVQEFEGQRRRLTLTRSEEGRWSLNGSECAELDGCVDVDLGLSPITNALPINRLGLAPGRSAEIVAAWVRFPQFTVEPMRQRYERLSDAVYRYSNVVDGFTATISVDDMGFPIEYEGIWTRIAEGPLTAGGLAPCSTIQEGFVSALLSDGPAPELGDAASVFGFLAGGWRATVRDFDPDGTVRTGTGEWWFAWVLEGRALQDVWISPPREERGRPPAPRAANNRYGTKLRRFDRAGKDWKIVWINPVSGAENHLRGGRDGDTITLVGEDDGRPIRWRFLDIRDDAFIWQGHRLDGNGHWVLEAEFQLTRIA